jgi:hypothetical protein
MKWFIIIINNTDNIYINEGMNPTIKKLIISDTIIGSDEIRHPEGIPNVCQSR